MGKKNRKQKTTDALAALSRDTSKKQTSTTVPSLETPVGGIFPRNQMLIVAVVALAFRLLFLLVYRNSPFYHVPVVDASTFDLWARAIIDGQPFQPDVYFKPPLFPFLLSFFYKIFGTQVTPVYLFHLVLGCGSSVLVLGIGRLLFSGRTALVGALICALLPILPFFEFQLLAETVTTFLSLLGLFVLLRGFLVRGGPTSWQLLIAGALFGIAAIGRPNLLLVPPVLAVWLYLRMRQPTVNDSRKPLIPAFLLVAGMFVAVFPTAIRNLNVGGDLVLVSANSGANLWAGNHPDADGVSPIQIGCRWDDLQLRCEQAGARGAVESSRHLTGLARRQMIQNPARTAGRFLKKLIVMVGAHEGRNNIGAGFLATNQGVFLLHRFWPGFWIMGPFALLGILGALRPRLLGDPQMKQVRPESRLLLLYLAALAISVLPFFVNARFRMPLLPIMALFAAHGALSLIDLIRREGGRRAVAGIVILVLAIVLVNVDWFGLNKLVTGARDEFNLAAIHAKGYAGNQPDLRRAEEHFRRAATIDPLDPDIPERHGLALISTALPVIGQAEMAFQQGRQEESVTHRRTAARFLDQAMALHQQAIRLFPRAFNSHANVGNCALWLGDAFREAAIIAVSHDDTGIARDLALEALSYYNVSGNAYDQSLKLKPGQQMVQSNMGLLRQNIMALPPLDPAIEQFQQRLR